MKKREYMRKLRKHLRNHYAKYVGMVVVAGAVVLLTRKKAVEDDSAYWVEFPLDLLREMKATGRTARLTTEDGEVFRLTCSPNPS